MTDEIVTQKAVALMEQIESVKRAHANGLVNEDLGRKLIDEYCRDRGKLVFVEVIKSLVFPEQS